MTARSLSLKPIRNFWDKVDTKIRTRKYVNKEVLFTVLKDDGMLRATG